MKQLILLSIVCPGLFASGHNVLLPQPQQVRYGSGRLSLDGLAVAGGNAAEDKFTAARLTAGLALRGGRPGARTIRLIRTGPVDALPRDNEPAGPNSREAYHIRVSTSGAEVRAASSAGLFYGAETVLQLVEGDGTGASLPAVEIDDWPSMAYRGVMFDKSHGALPTEEAVKRQIDFLAQWKGNQYYFYSEVSIELKGYPLLAQGGRYTREQVRRIIAYARERHVDVVPCLEFFGHLHDVFRVERYARLSVSPHGGDLNPRNEEMLRMLEDWVGQMAALFPSSWLHMGLDEPWELERGGSAATGVEPGKLYLEQLTRMSAMVRKHGKRPMFWADITSGARVFDKYPELMAKLPAGLIPVPWRYGDEKDYTAMLEPFQKAGIPTVIGTGITAWDTILPDYHVTFGNIDGFVRDGRRFGAIGILNTEWSDDAQILYRTTQPGIAYGAAAAWQSEPMDRAAFFRNYSALVYRGADAEPVAKALEALDDGEQSIKAALGSESMFRIWDEALAPSFLARARSHVEDLRNARLKAEEAEELLAGAATRYPELASVMIGARLLDYAGMKFIYAAEIAEGYEKLKTSADRTDLSFWLRNASRNHSRAADLMDEIGELREIYRERWDAEYTPYRRATALARFDAELEYWRKFQARVWEFGRTFRQGGNWPALESFGR